MGAGGTWELSVLSLNFAINLKLLKNKKSVKKFSESE